jgi:hypothetical protein
LQLKSDITKGNNNEIHQTREQADIQRLDALFSDRYKNIPSIIAEFTTIDWQDQSSYQQKMFDRLLKRTDVYDIFKHLEVFDLIDRVDSHQRLFERLVQLKMTYSAIYVLDKLT